MNSVAWIALGSNLGDRKATLDGALHQLRSVAAVRVETVSSWLETEPVGGPAGQSAFLNGVLRCTTTLTPQALLGELQRIETQFGRDRTSGVANGPRTLDLDLLMFDVLELSGPALTLPHLGLEDRTFVLEPLAEIDAELRLPRSQKTVRERLLELQVNA